MRRYIEHKFKSINLESENSGYQILKSLNKALTDQIFMNMYLPFLSNYKGLKKHFSEKVIKKIALKV